MVLLDCRLVLLDMVLLDCRLELSSSALDALATVGTVSKVDDDSSPPECKIGDFNHDLELCCNVGFLELLCVETGEQ